MKDCRYVYKDNFIDYYKVVDDKLIVYYGNGNCFDYDYSFDLENEIILKMERQIEENILFKKMWSGGYCFSKVFFYFSVIFSIDSVFKMIDDVSFFSVLYCLMSLGISFSDIFLFVNSDRNLREIKKQEYFYRNKDLVDDLVTVNNLDDFELSDLVKLRDDFNKGLVRKR